jgi:hypothetical protein
MSTLLDAKTHHESVGISAATMSRLIGVSPAQLSNAYRSIARLTPEKQERLASVSFELFQLATAVAPLRLPDEVSELQRLLKHLKDNAITAEEIHNALVAVLGTKE